LSRPWPTLRMGVRTRMTWLAPGTYAGCAGLAPEPNACGRSRGVRALRTGRAVMTGLRWPLAMRVARAAQQPSPGTSTAPHEGQSVVDKVHPFEVDIGRCRLPGAPGARPVGRCTYLRVHSTPAYLSPNRGNATSPLPLEFPLQRILPGHSTRTAYPAQSLQPGNQRCLRPAFLHHNRACVPQAAAMKLPWNLRSPVSTQRHASRSCGVKPFHVP
jgi:hypothetical protein